VRRADPAGGEYQVVRPCHLSNCFHDDREFVGDGQDAADVNSQVPEFPDEIRRVLVGDFSAQDLAADDQDACSPRHPLTRRCDRALGHRPDRSSLNADG
jgi:hypothetical protein